MIPKDTVSKHFNKTNCKCHRKCQKLTPYHQYNCHNHQKHNAMKLDTRHPIRPFSIALHNANEFEPAFVKQSAI